MEIGLLLKVAGVGLLVGILCQILKGTGRDDLASLTAVAGVILALSLLLTRIGELIATVRTLFGF